jgi:hypothetical protein
MKRKSNEITTKHFRGNPEYKSAFSAAVTEFIANMISPELRQLYEKKREMERANDADGLARVNAEIMRHRTERSRAIEALIDEYIASTGERPDAAELERLANAVLHEELTDDDEHKMSREEYPIMSERQHERRVVREPMTDTPENLQQRRATRRKRTVYEMLYVDRNAKIRNRERRKAYREFTKVQPVITYNLNEK